MEVPDNRAGDESIKLHTLRGIFNLSNISFGIQTIQPVSEKIKPIHRSSPHRHDSYFIKYIEEGKGTHNIDFRDYEVFTHSIFLMAPGQVHSFEMSNVKGFIIYFKTDMISIADLPFFNHSYSSPALYFDKKDLVVDSIFHSLMFEYSQKDFGRNDMIKALLQELLILLTRKYLQQKDEKQQVLSKHVEIVRKLNDLIELNFIEYRNIAFYAEALYISPRQLNHILKENVGTSISALIHHRLLIEAKRLLCYTDKTISEIAYSLNFTDKTYFHKFFKANENQTPEQFRKSILMGDKNA